MAAGEKTEAVERFWQAFRTAAYGHAGKQLPLARARLPLRRPWCGRSSIKRNSIRQYNCEPNLGISIVRSVSGFRMNTGRRPKIR